MNVTAVLERHDRLAADGNDAGQVVWARDAGLDVVRVHGRLTGDRRVAVEPPSWAPESPNSSTEPRSPSSGRVPLDILWHAIPAFPTQSEIWLRFLEALGL